MLSDKKNIEVFNKLLGIFKDRFDMDFSSMEEAALDEELLGRKLKLKPRDLLYIFFDIEKEFGIAIPEKEIDQGSFNTFNSIVETISSQLLRKTG